MEKNHPIRPQLSVFTKKTTQKQKQKANLPSFFFYELTIKEKLKFRKMLKDNSLKDITVIFSVNHLITLKKTKKNKQQFNTPV